MLRLNRPNKTAAHFAGSDLRGTWITLTHGASSYVPTGYIYDPAVWTGIVIAGETQEEIPKECYTWRYSFLSFHVHTLSTPTGEHSHFLEYATELAAALRNTIFVDQVRLVEKLGRDLSAARTGCLSNIEEAGYTAASRGTYFWEHRQGGHFVLSIHCLLS